MHAVFPVKCVLLDIRASLYLDHYSQCSILFNSSCRSETNVIQLPKTRPRQLRPCPIRPIPTAMQQFSLSCDAGLQIWQSEVRDIGRLKVRCLLGSQMLLSKFTNPYASRMSSSRIHCKHIRTKPESGSVLGASNRHHIRVQKGTHLFQICRVPMLVVIGLKFLSV